MGNLLQKLSIPFFFIACSSPILAQEKQDLYELSLEELMNVAIVSASSQEETLFEAPVSSYSITRDEISKSGVSSIPEALRLAPGVIVRETTNGNFDVHINGFDNPVRYTGTSSQINMLTLVMINNRPVFSLGQGGTHWEALPISLIDIERIEVVRGPSAPLFGPNAVTGVINIITKDFDSENLYIAGNIQQGLPSSTIGDFAIGKKISEKLNLAVSGNFQNRERYDNQYYIYGLDTYINSEDYKAEQKIDHSMAIDKIGINGYINYELNEKANFDLSFGGQQSDAQKVHYVGTLPLTFTEKENAYLNFGTQIHGINARVSYELGEDNLMKQNYDTLFSTAYKYHILDATVDYQWKISNKFHLRPALNLMESRYDGRDFAQKTYGGGLFNGDYTINSRGASLRADIFPVENIRLVAGVRGDMFSVKEDPAYSYQLLATYNIQDNWLIRIAQSNSKSGVFYQQLLDLTVMTPTEGGMFLYQIDADPNHYKVVSNSMTEFGLRGKISRRLQFDLSLFRQKLTNLNELTTVDGGVKADGTPYATAQYLNLPFELKQIGSTISVNFVPNDKWQFKPFITVQKTETEKFFNYNTPGAPQETSKHNSTPGIYGGFFANFAPSSKFNLNLNSYFFGKQTMYHQTDTYRPTNNNEVAAKLLLNAKASYEIVDKFRVYLGAKNILNQDTREYYGADRMGASYFAGASYNF